MRKDAQNHPIVFDQYESDYYTVGSWPWCNSDTSDKPDFPVDADDLVEVVFPDDSDIEDIYDEHDMYDNPGIQDEGYEPIGIGYLGDIG